MPIPVVTGGGGAPAIGATSVSEGVIPVGLWPGTVNADTAARFSVDTPVFTVSAGSLFGSEQIGRRLQLNAEPALNGPGHPHSLQENVYVGEYFEILTSTGGAPLGTQPGGFILLRDIPAPLPVLTQLVP